MSSLLQAAPGTTIALTAKRAKPIAVPAEAVRTAERILAGLVLTQGGSIVWATCWNCGGTGNYPSSMTPPGRCRLYCWAVSTGDPFNPYRSKAPDDPTFGLLPTPTAKYVAKAQASDRAQYRATVRAAQAAAEREARLTAGLDPRMAALAAAFSLDPANLPVVNRVPGDDYYAYIEGQQVSVHVDQAVSLIAQWTAKGELTDKQWALVANLPAWEQERTERAAARETAKLVSQYVGTVGDRLDLVVRVESVKDIETTAYGWSRATRHVDLIKLRDATGNLFLWWNDRLATPTVGATLKLRGTVKKHDDYKGERQTTLQRVTLIEED